MAAEWTCHDRSHACQNNIPFNLRNYWQRRDNEMRCLKEPYRYVWYILISANRPICTLCITPDIWPLISCSIKKTFKSGRLNIFRQTLATVYNLQGISACDSAKTQIHKNQTNKSKPIIKKNKKNDKLFLKF